MTRALHSDDPPVLGGYQLDGRLGESRRGVVYSGRRGGPPVAIKLLHAGGPSLEALPKVPPFCVARVLEVGLAGTRPYVVSELVPGPSLRTLVEFEGPRGGQELDQLAVRVLTGLAAIHQAGLVHGNLHPGNVVCGPAGATVTDAGVARGGEPAFAAPEQVAADRFTPAGDVFAWASTMVYAATGRPPFGDQDAASVLHRVLQDQPALDGMSGTLRDVVARCLAKDPSERPGAQAAQQLLISGVPSGPAPAAARRPPARPPAPRKRRDVRVPILAGATTIAVVGAVIGWAVMRQEPPPSPVLAGNQQRVTPTASPTPTPSTSKPSPTRTPRKKRPRTTPPERTVVVMPPPQVTVTRTQRAKPTRTRRPTPKQTPTRRSPTPERTSAPTPSPTREQRVAAGQRLRNAATGLCLVIRDGDRTPGAKAAQWHCNDFPQQRWSFKGGLLVNSGTGLCLAIGHGKATPGKTAVQWTCTGGHEQRWAYDGQNRLKNQATGLCLAIGHGQATPGKHAIQWKCGGGAEQRWPAG